MINENNYEAWLLQYHDGTLDKSDVSEVEAFLHQHPHIAENDRLYYSDTPLVTSIDSTYLFKGFLKHSPDNEHKRWHWTAVASIVGLLVAVWLWRAQEPSPSQPLVVRNTAVPLETKISSVVQESEQPPIKTTESSTLGAVALAKHPLSHHDEHIEPPTDVEQMNETSTAIVPVPPEHCESDQLVVYGCPVVNSNSLVLCPDDQPTCNNLACRLHLTGQRLGIL